MSLAAASCAHSCHLLFTHRLYSDKKRSCGVCLIQSSACKYNDNVRRHCASHAKVRTHIPEAWDIEQLVKYCRGVQVSESARDDYDVTGRNRSARTMRCASLFIQMTMKVR